MEKGKEFLKPFIIPGLVITVLLIVALTAARMVLPVLEEKENEETRIIKITAVNDKKYEIQEEIAPEDFTVTAEFDNGKEEELDVDAYEISDTYVQPVGEKTEITVTLKDDSRIYCKMEVAAKRERILGFHCGYPDESKVVAVLYSNGELSFEGEGDTLQFEAGEFPWMNYEGREDYPICSVSFGERVSPGIMDNWFRDMDTLTYVSKLPSSVKSLSGTFQDCDGLIFGADWSSCNELLDISSVYEDCDCLASVPAVPASVRIADYACANCGSLQTSPDLTKAENLVSAYAMFYNCKKLTKTSIAPRLQNISSMYERCINLQEIPELPETVTEMDSTFSRDFSLKSLPAIPPNVKDLDSCFRGCIHAGGTLVIDANPNYYSNFLDDAISATRLDLTGSSEMLNELGLEADNRNVTVNGEVPGKEEAH